MSSLELAHYMQKRMDTLGLTITDASRQSGISRQTWYKLIQADIREAKLNTLIKVASALKTTPVHLMDIYFQKKVALYDFDRDEQPRGYIPGITHNTSNELGPKTL